MSQLTCGDLCHVPSLETCNYQLVLAGLTRAVNSREFRRTVGGHR
jgi:hypothetical protein